MRLENRGKTGIFNKIIKVFTRLAKKISFFQKQIDKKLELEAKQTVAQNFDGKSVKPVYRDIPEKGVEHTKILSTIDERKKADIDPTIGKTFAYVYEQSKAHSEMTAACFNKYIHSNALNPIVFNSLRVFEVEVVKMCSQLFNGDDNCVGNVTSCGT